MRTCFKIAVGIATAGRRDILTEALRELSRQTRCPDKVFVCPHFKEDGCYCRKPKTGLLDEFLRTTNVDLANSFVCGDRASDKGLATAIGVAYLPMKTNGNFYQAIKPIIRSKS